MTLQEFKVIFYWEYFHRILGRVIGVFYLLPLIYFHFRKKIEKNFLIPCYTILLLILIQGVVGWYMVKSGLVNDVTVSHYRLSLHLTMQLLLYQSFLVIIEFKNKKFKIFSISKSTIPFLF